MQHCHYDYHYAWHYHRLVHFYHTSLSDIPATLVDHIVSMEGVALKGTVAYNHMSSSIFGSYTWRKRQNALAITGDAEQVYGGNAFYPELSGVNHLS